jgi:hypothetical protein
MIKLKANGKEYILEYDRETITYIEKMGFSLEKYSSQPMTMYPLLFKGAFYKHHKFVKEQEKDELYNNIRNRSKLMNALVEMVGEAYEELVKDNEEGNADWEIV